MPKRLFIAGFDTETNTFVPIPTGRKGFEEGFIAHGNATSLPENYCSAQLHIWRRRAEEHGLEVIESLCTYAEPGGLMVRHVYEEFRDAILADLERAAPVDMVILALHGAMAADGYPDCEGDLLRRIRAIVGTRAIIGAEFDLHAHLTDAMVEHADILVGYKEYPHIDIPDRAEELFTLVHDAACGRTRPVMALADCRMIGTFRPTQQPLRGFVDRMKEMEGRDGILSVSLSHSFPWADNPDVGAKVLVVADGDRALAQARADALRDEFFAMRHEIAPRFLELDAALDEALAAEGGPVVIADVADNAGGGAPSDSTFCLNRLIERNISNVATGYYWDPIAVKFCFEAGLGARFELRIGGKCGRTSGQPLDLEVTVKGLATDVTQRFGRAASKMGDVAWVEANGIDIILTTLRCQVFHPEGFTKLGLDLASRKIVIVKSIQHFHAGFAPMAERILYVAAPGALSPDFANLPYTQLQRPYWPRVEDPFATES